MQRCSFGRTQISIGFEWTRTMTIAQALQSIIGLINLDKHRWETWIIMESLLQILLSVISLHGRSSVHTIAHSLPSWPLTRREDREEQMTSSTEQKPVSTAQHKWIQAFVERKKARKKCLTFTCLFSSYLLSNSASFFFFPNSIGLIWLGRIMCALRAHPRRWLSLICSTLLCTFTRHLHWKLRCLALICSVLRCTGLPSQLLAVLDLSFIAFPFFCSSFIWTPRREEKRERNSMEWNASPGLGSIACSHMKAWRDFGPLVFRSSIVFVSR